MLKMLPGAVQMLVKPTAMQILLMMPSMRPRQALLPLKPKPQTKGLRQRRYLQRSYLQPKAMGHPEHAQDLHQRRYLQLQACELEVVTVGQSVLQNPQTVW